MAARLASLLLALLLAGCGAKLRQSVETSPWQTLPVVDPFAAPDFSPLAVWRAEVLSQSDRAWAVPQVIATTEGLPPATGKPQLPAGTLLRVEISVWDKVSCRDVAPGQRRTLPGKPRDAVAPAELPAMDADALPPQDRLQERTDVWVVPADVAGAHFSLGPAWFGCAFRRT